MSGKRPAAGGKGNRRVGKGKKGCVRGVGGQATLTSAEERPSCSQTKMSTSFSGQSDLLPYLRTRSSLQIPDEAQKEKVLERISSAFSSGLSNTSTSTSQLIQSSELSPQSQLVPHSSQVSSCPSQYGVAQMAASAELFDHTIAWESEVRSIAPVNPDVEMVCTDGQKLCESDPGTDVEGSEHNVDSRSQTVTPVGGDSEEDSEIEDDTHNLSLPSGQEEVGSEDAGCENTQGDVDDDDVGDPTYCQPTVRQSMRSPEEDASDDEVRLRLPVQRRSTGSTPTSASSTTTLPLSSSRGGTSGHKASKPCIAWAFFEVAKDDPTHVICKICQQNLSRGKQINSLSTSCMKRHMEMKHNSQWDAHCARMRPSGPGQPPSAPSCASAASSSSVTGGTARSRGYGRRTSTSLTATASVIGSTSSLVDLEVETPAANITCPPAPSSDTSSLRGTPDSTPSEQTIQPSVRQMWITKKPFSPSHDRAKRLNFKICKLLAGQMLPFRLVDTEDFRDLMADAVPQYQMPSRHYFSKKAVPALHQHVAHNIMASLKSSVCDRVHFTTDTWTSRHGQGRYMSLTGHWVTMVRAGEGAAVYVLPSPRVVRQSSLSRSSSTASTSSTSRSSTCSQSLSGNATHVVTAQKESCTPPYYAGSRAQRHQAVFTLKCLGNVSHTAEELWSALETEFHKWLSPLNLQPGKAVCDNAANLGAALRRGNVTHVPCMAHVLNLVVHQFLAHYPGLDGILQRARSLCAHFRRSHPAYQRLSSIQKSLGLPVHRLKCDVPTRWNSTLHMLQRLWQHRRALVQYVMTYSLGHRDPEVGQITLQEWSQIRDLCTLLHSFEMATNMFSADDAIISMTIPVIYMLEQTLLSIRSQVVGQEEEGEEVQEESYAEGRISPRSRRLVAARRQALEGEGEGLMRVHGSRQTVEQRAVAEEEVEDELPMGVADSSDDGDLEDISVVRGWGERAFEGSMTVLSPPQTQQGLGPRGCARHMSAFLLHYLQHDPRIVKIRSSADYWLATLLDPRYKNKFMELIPAIERDSRMQEYQQTLLHNLRSAFPQNTSGARSGSESQSYNLTPMGLSSYHSNRNMAGGGNSNFVESFHQFFRPSFARPQETRSLTHSQRLERMVQEYLQVNIDGMTVEVDPCSFWASNLEKWPELATHALEVLSCPAASVLSERVFSAAGGVLTDKRTRLSTESVDRLTFIKMNKSWIRKDFSTPVSSWGD